MLIRRQRIPTPFPYTTLFRSTIGTPAESLGSPLVCIEEGIEKRVFWAIRLRALAQDARTLLTLSCAHVPDEENEMARSEEHTSELQSRQYLVCRLLLEKKKQR